MIANVKINKYLILLIYVSIYALKINLLVSKNYVIEHVSSLNVTLHEKCPNTKFFLVRVFPPSGWIQENADQK